MNCILRNFNSPLLTIYTYLFTSLFATSLCGYHDDEIILGYQGENNYYGKNVTQRPSAGWNRSSATAVVINPTTPLPAGRLVNISVYLTVASSSDAPTPLVLQIWRPLPPDVLQLVWMKRIYHAASSRNLHTFAVEGCFGTESGDVIGWSSDPTWTVSYSSATGASSTLVMYEHPARNFVTGDTIYISSFISLPFEFSIAAQIIPGNCSDISDPPIPENHVAPNGELSPASQAWQRRTKRDSYPATDYHDYQQVYYPDSSTWSTPVTNTKRSGTTQPTGNRLTFQQPSSSSLSTLNKSSSSSSTTYTVANETDILTTTVDDYQQQEQEHDSKIKQDVSLFFIVLAVVAMVVVVIIIGVVFYRRYRKLNAKGSTVLPTRQLSAESLATGSSVVSNDLDLYDVIPDSGDRDADPVNYTGLNRDPHYSALGSNHSYTSLQTRGQGQGSSNVSTLQESNPGSNHTMTSQDPVTPTRLLPAISETTDNQGYLVLIDNYSSHGNSLPVKNLRVGKASKAPGNDSVKETTGGETPKKYESKLKTTKTLSTAARETLDPGTSYRNPVRGAFLSQSRHVITPENSHTAIPFDKTRASIEREQQSKASIDTSRNHGYLELIY